MPTPMDEVSCARIPLGAFPLLAALRIEPGVQAALTLVHAWIRWPAGNEHVLQTVMPIHEAVLFSFREGRWHQYAQALPAFDFPTDLEYRPLAHVLFPAPVQPLAANNVSVQPVRLTLRRDDRPRNTTALLCTLLALIAWSDTVPTARLALLQGVYLDQLALVLGDHLPVLPTSTRFWGKEVLIPLGYEPEPALPESAIIEAIGLLEDQLLLWQPERAEVIDRGQLTSLSRAAIRLALRSSD